MPIARLITRMPEFAQRLAQSLEDAGYSIEFAAPEDALSSPADLEVNLDDPSAASSYLVTADGKEISFAYDPVEREFILAPTWRRMLARFARLRERFRRPEPEVQRNLASSHDLEPVDAHGYVADPAAGAVVEDCEPARVATAIEPDGEEEDLAPTTVLEEAAVLGSTAMPGMEASVIPAEPTAQSLYLPDSMIVEATAEPDLVQFSGIEYFDGQGARRRPGNMEQPLTTLPDAEEPGQETEVACTTPVPSQPQRTPRLVQAALQAETLRSSLVSRWNAGKASTSAAGARLRGHDASWLRAAPVAALLAIAFLLGWGYSDSQRPARAAQPASQDVKEATIAPVTTPQPARPALRSTSAVQPTTAKLVARRRASKDDEDVADDVVVRHYSKHYPSKEVRASNHKNAIKRFSDIN